MLNEFGIRIHEQGQTLDTERSDFCSSPECAALLFLSSISLQVKLHFTFVVNLLRAHGRLLDHQAEIKGAWT